MPRKVRAASCIVNHLTSNFRTQDRGLWVTDALLAETFHNFCLSARRHGSNVPGPLEARRRASKRKNTSLAYAGNAAIPIHDPAVVLGSRTNDQWWKQIETAPSRATEVHQVVDQGYEGVDTSSFLPAWLFKSRNSMSSAGRDGQDQLAPDEYKVAVQDSVGLQNKQTLFRTRIEQTATLMDIQTVVEDLRVDLRHDTELREIAFGHLLSIDGKDSQLKILPQVLQDPDFNPPGSSNHLLFVRHFCKSHIVRRKWANIAFPALLKAIQLGLVSTADLQKIILELPVIYTRRLKYRDDNQLHTDWHQLLVSADQSRVLNLDDMDLGFLSSWYQQIRDVPQTEATYNLLWRLRRYSDLTKLELASQLTISRLQRIVEAEITDSTKLLEWLATLPPKLHGAVLIQTTFKMIAQAQRREQIAVQMLQQWAVVLPQSYSEQLDFPINKSTWSQASVDLEELNPAQQLLTVIWIATRLCAHNPDAAIRLANTDLRDEFESTFTNMQGVDQFDHVSRVVLTLDTLSLPFKDQIFPFLQHFSQENLIKMLGNEDYLNGLMACFRLEFAQLRDNLFAYRAEHNFPEVLRALSESINDDLPQFKAMAQILILKSNHNFRVVRRLLQYNMATRFAASRSWPSLSSECKDETTQSGSDPRAILEILEQLTMTFAVSPATSPRSSFRHVSKMFSFLHKIGAPTNPIISRAIWHSGVTRYSQVGAPRAQLLWCMSKVREIEGAEVANQLLWSAGFRETYVQDFVHNLKNSKFPSELTEASTEVVRELGSDKELLQTQCHSDKLDESPVVKTSDAEEGESISTMWRMKRHNGGRIPPRRAVKPSPTRAKSSRVVAAHTLTSSRLDK